MGGIKEKGCLGSEDTFDRKWDRSTEIWERGEHEGEGQSKLRISESHKEAYYFIS